MSKNTAQKKRKNFIQISFYSQIDNDGLTEAEMGKPNKSRFFLVKMKKKTQNSGQSLHSWVQSKHFGLVQPRPTIQSWPTKVKAAPAAANWLHCETTPTSSGCTFFFGVGGQREIPATFLDTCAGEAAIWEFLSIGKKIYL